MTQVYFHCSSAREVRVDQCGAAVSSLAEARDYAACIVRALIMADDQAIGWRLRQLVMRAGDRMAHRLEAL